MVKHIVVYTLKEGVDKDAAVKLIASKLEPLVGQIPGLLKMEVRRCYQGCDYALYSEFEKPEAITWFFDNPVVENMGDYWVYTALSFLVIATMLQAPAWVVFACLKCDQVLKCTVAVVKINSFNWMKKLTR